MATATGKTVAGIAAIADICCAFPNQSDSSEPDNARILIVAHSNAILKQWEREIQEKLGLPCHRTILVTKPQTLRSNGRVEFQLLSHCFHSTTVTSLISTISLFTTGPPLRERNRVQGGD